MYLKLYVFVLIWEHYFKFLFMIMLDLTRSKNTLKMYKLVEKVGIYLDKSNNIIWVIPIIYYEECITTGHIYFTQGCFISW